MVQQNQNKCLCTSAFAQVPSSFRANTALPQVFQRARFVRGTFDTHRYSKSKLNVLGDRFKGKPKMLNLFSSLWFDLRRGSTLDLATSRPLCCHGLEGNQQKRCQSREQELQQKIASCFLTSHVAMFDKGPSDKTSNRRSRFGWC